MKGESWTPCGSSTQRTSSWKNRCTVVRSGWRRTSRREQHFVDSVAEFKNFEAKKVGIGENVSFYENVMDWVDVNGAEIHAEQVAVAEWRGREDRPRTVLLRHVVTPDGPQLVRLSRGPLGSGGETLQHGDQIVRHGVGGFLSVDPHLPRAPDQQAHQ